MVKTTTPTDERCPPRPLRRDAERNRQRILAAASVVFARDGLDVPLDDIAAHAGVGIATMYRRFPTRDELIDALLHERIKLVILAAEEALELKDAWQGLVTFMERSQALFAADRGLADAVFDSGRRTATLKAVRQRITPLVDELIRRAQAQGQLREDIEPTDIPVFQLMVSMVARGTVEVAPDVWARYLGVIIDGLRTQRRRPTPLPAPALDQLQLETALDAARLARSRRSQHA